MSSRLIQSESFSSNHSMYKLFYPLRTTISRCYFHKEYPLLTHSWAWSIHSLLTPGLGVPTPYLLLGMEYPLPTHSWAWCIGAAAEAAWSGTAATARRRPPWTPWPEGERKG